MSPVLDSFLDEFLKDGIKIIIETFNPKDSAVSNSYSTTIHFLIFEVRFTVLLKGVYLRPESW